MSETRMIGQIGVGAWGKNILRNLCECGVLKKACDLDPVMLASAGAVFPGVEICSSPEEILKDPDIRAVVISTPAHTHYHLAHQALLSGRDVFVEKPMALSVAEGENLAELAEKNGLILMVGHVLHYHPAMRKLRELLRSGELGRIQYLYSNRLSFGRIRTGENILWSFAPHDISALLELAGEEPERVATFAGTYITPGIPDAAFVGMDFPGGVKGHIHVSWISPFKEQRMVIAGTQAIAVFDDVASDKLVVYSSSIEWKDGKHPVAKRDKGSPVTVEQEEPLRAELLHFIDAVRNRTRPETDGPEGVRVLRVLEMAERGITWSGGRFGASESERYFAHETACIDNDSEIGDRVRIWHFAHVLSGTKIGDGTIVGQNVMIGPDVKIGAGCKIQNNVSVYKGVTLEDEVFCGPSCVFTNVYTPRAFIERKHEFLPTLVRRGATIGANATIVCGATVGRFAVVGAGAVIKGDVPDHAIVAGVPARQIGWACVCGRRLQFREDLAECTECRSVYKLENGSCNKQEANPEMIFGMEGARP